MQNDGRNSLGEFGGGDATLRFGFDLPLKIIIFEKNKKGYGIISRNIR
jgi:hypothetical protein